MKTLAFDLETSYAEVRTWQLFKPILGPKNIITPSRVICWSAQWVEGTRKSVMFASEHHNGRKEMLQQLYDLLLEADAIVTYNGKRFDWPWIVGEFIAEGFDPLPKTPHIDLYQVVRGNGRFLSNKLDYIAERLIGERKVEHQGLQLWIDCLAGDDKAWATMRKYAKQDTALLPKLYDILKPWVQGVNRGPNRAVVDDVLGGCASCASTNVQRRGYLYTAKKRKQRYQCQDCKHWFSE